MGPTNEDKPLPKGIAPGIREYCREGEVDAFDPEEETVCVEDDDNDVADEEMTEFLIDDIIVVVEDAVETTVDGIEGARRGTGGKCTTGFPG